jgi:hypothetical protein
MGERFSMTEMTALRNELAQGALDSLQAAELLQIFLMGHGYGVSPEAAHDAAGRLEGRACSLEKIQRELEGLALMQ